MSIVKDMGPLNTLLGIRIVLDNRIQLDQPGYIEKLVEKHGITKSTNTPWPSDFNRRDELVLLADEHAQYRTIVGELAWLANASRPDLMHAVSLLSHTGKGAVDMTQTGPENARHETQ